MTVFADLIPIAERIAARLVERQESVAVSESSAGGLVSAALLAVPKASVWYQGASVTYTPNVARGLLGLSRGDLPEGVRSSTEPYALFMAGVIREKLRGTWGLCETGAAGPEGNPYGDAAGHTCVGVVGPTTASFTLETGASDRPANMLLFARFALERFEAVIR
ncbi:CinA family protein [Caulobacter mirabilis]|uniref:Damage-inducible protein n=1 Tax=Caulobacter mirabilis TaxID=69666 RepID=A0A2D2AVL4_9CAUL|nr:CinA family protein [Caulobacter mirabilis]ATQ42044.1 damage-inducible protein [Caulobacter mirabilis]